MCLNRLKLNQSQANPPSLQKHANIGGSEQEDRQGQQHLPMSHGQMKVKYRGLGNGDEDKLQFHCLMWIIDKGFNMVLVSKWYYAFSFACVHTSWLHAHMGLQDKSYGNS